MKRTLVSAAVLALLAGGASVAVAEPGPNGKNNHGLCTAYFKGSETGQANKRKAGPFAKLEEVASDGDDSTSPEEDVRAFCAQFLGGNGNGNGNNGNPNAGGGKGGRG